MMNIEQITNRLAQMPDQALQQYAMMHKDDPYIMALAVSESRRRKQMRAAAAPQPQAQPKVAEQALMEMGVDALPTQEMDFAGGGIVAFADGGDVERYQVGGSTYETPYDRMNRLNREREERERQERLARIEAEGGSTMSYGEQMGNVGRFIDQFVPDPRNIFKTLVSAPGYGLSKDVGATTARGPAATYDPATATRRAEYETPGAARTVTTSAAAPAAGGLGATPEAAAMRKPSPIGAPSVQDAKDTAKQFYDPEAEKKAINDYMVRRRNQIAEMRSRYEEGKPEGKAYSKFEEMLKAEEGRAGKEKDEATGVAIFKAGLAMMAGASPRAFENIGKGALTGLEEYSSAMKDMKKAAKERQKAFAEIENARRAEERDDWKAKNAAEAKFAEYSDNAERYGIEGISKVTGKGADISKEIYKLNVEQQGALQRTQISAAASQARLGGAEDRQTLAELKALQTSIKDQLKDPRMMGPRGDGLRAQLEQINATIARMAGLGTMPVAPGAAGPGGTMSGWGKASVVNP